MFNRTIIQSYLNYPLTDELWGKIQKLEDYDSLIRRKTYDYRGKHFSNLTVIGRGPTVYIGKSNQPRSQWWCICDCSAHNIILVHSNNLTSGNTKSCGCLNTARRKKHMQQVGKSMILDLTGEQFGELTVLSLTEERKNTSPVWKCRCSCGKIHYATTHDLRNHYVESCGHLQESKGVRYIKKTLDENNIRYETEKTFSDCKSPKTNKSLRFDFYIPDKNLLIEYDGEQHFKERPKGFFKDSLEERQFRDRYKNEYCKQHNIPLIRIPYTELNHLSLDLILGDRYLI